MSSAEKEKKSFLPIIQKASPDDADELKQLLLRANAYSLQLSDVPTWKNIPLSLANIEKQLTGGNTYVIRAPDGVITSTISLSETDVSWNDTSGEDGALYFTKFMKHPERAQPEEPRELLLFAANEAKKRGKSLLRCDVAKTQEGMITYYEKIGFQKKGDFSYTSGRPGTLLEIPVSQFLNNVSRAQQNNSN